MMIEERQQRILEELRTSPDLTVRELAKRLSVSEPTVRRDFTELHKKGFITKRYGGAILNMGAADREIPFLLREQEKSSVKTVMGAKAAELVRDGLVVMLDGSTSAYHLVPYLARLKEDRRLTCRARCAYLFNGRSDDHSLVLLRRRASRELCQDHQRRHLLFLLPWALPCGTDDRPRH